MSHRSPQELVWSTHLYTWFIFGAGFLLLTYRWSCSNPGQGILLPIALLALYVAVGRAVGKSIARFFTMFLARSPGEPFSALFNPSLIHGLITAAVSVLIHWLWISHGESLQAHAVFQMPMPAFRALWVTLIGAGVFPFLACMSASALVDKRMGLFDEQGRRLGMQ